MRSPQPPCSSPPTTHGSTMDRCSVPMAAPGWHESDRFRSAGGGGAAGERPVLGPDLAAVEALRAARSGRCCAHAGGLRRCRAARAPADLAAACGVASASAAAAPDLPGRRHRQPVLRQRPDAWRGSARDAAVLPRADVERARRTPVPRRTDHRGPGRYGDLVSGWCRAGAGQRRRSDHGVAADGSAGAGRGFPLCDAERGLAQSRRGAGRVEGGGGVLRRRCSRRSA